MKIHAGKFEIPITRKNIKRLRMKISSTTGLPEISAPLSMHISEIETFARKHIDWLEKNVVKVQARVKLKNSRQQIKDNGVIMLFGKQHKLRITETAKHSTITFDGETVFMKIPPNTDTEKKNKVLERFYKRELEYFINEILPHWEKTVNENPKHLKYRSMKTRWGSCNSTKSIVTLNTKLAIAPRACIEMVLVHELIHFKEFYHNEKFKSYMTKYLPNWRETTKILKAY